MYASTTLPRWTHPEAYAGHDPIADYMLCGQSRDSSSLERSNYQRIFEDVVKKAIELGQPEGIESDYHEDEPNQFVYDFRASHWAVGWVDQVILKASAPEELIRFCEEIRDALDGYPVYDEEHWSTLEYEEANDYWASISVRERCEIIKERAPEVSIFAARRDYIPDNDGGIDEYCRD